MTEALPIGNGPIGAMLFGGTEVERIQFNEISLWSGARMAGDRSPLGVGEKDANEMGAYQVLGDVLLHLGHDLSKVTDYRRELDIDSALHQVGYQFDGVGYHHAAFASHPDGVIVIELWADLPGTCSGLIQLADMHEAKIEVKDNRIVRSGLTLEVEAPMDPRESSDIEITYLVVNSGTKTEIKNEDGQTALHCAVNTAKATLLVELLLKAGADISIKDQLENTALDYARKRNNTALVDILSLQ